MTVFELGAIGEFVSSFAVLATLVYLTIQIRRSRSEAKSNVQISRLQAIRDNWLNRSQNPELVDAIIKAEESLGPVFLNNSFIQALVERVGLSLREGYLIYFDQQVQWQNWVNTIESIGDQTPNSIARMNSGIRGHYKYGYAKLFWEMKREINVEKLPVEYIEGILAD